MHTLSKGIKIPLSWCINLFIKSLVKSFEARKRIKERTCHVKSSEEKQERKDLFDTDSQTVQNLWKKKRSSTTIIKT